MTAPDPAWPLLSPGSRKPDWVLSAACLDELRDEHDRRRQLYPGLVAKGRMTRETMERELDIVLALRDEIETGERCTRYTWHDKVHALRREINLRRNGYPRRIAKGQLTHEDAQRRLELFEQVHWHYWIDAFMTDDPRVVRPRPNRADYPQTLGGEHAYWSDRVAASAGRSEFFDERERAIAEQLAVAAA